MSFETLVFECKQQLKITLVNIGPRDGQTPTPFTRSEGTQELSIAIYHNRRNILRSRERRWTKALQFILHSKGRRSDGQRPNKHRCTSKPPSPLLHGIGEPKQQWHILIKVHEDEKDTVYALCDGRHKVETLLEPVQEEPEEAEE